MTKLVSIGVDVGGTNTDVGIVDREGKILSRKSLKTGEYLTAESFISQLCFEIKNLISDEEILGIGIGAPNGNFFTGNIEFAPNLRWKGIIEVKNLMKKEFNCPIFLTNDAKAAAIGEMVFGKAKKMKNFILLTLGTGLGSGIVVDGNLCYGHDGLAGEMGHTQAVFNGRECGCGNKGCLETYVSATGIKRTLFELLSRNISETPLRDFSFNALNSKIITDFALQNDSYALESFDITARYLGIKLAEVVAYFRPEAIFFFGGLSQAGDLLLKPARNYMEKYLLPVYCGKISLSISGLSQDAAILGAAAMIWKENL